VIAKAPRVSSIASGVPFLDTLADGIAKAVDHDPLALSRVTVLLPTRRAGRALREAFLRRADGAPMLLPRLRPLGDVDDDELAMVGDNGADLEPAIAPLRRKLMLARTILKLESSEGARTAPQAVELAGELARLLDEVQTEQISFDALSRLVPDEYAEHWRRTVKFLEILTAVWPKILATEGAIDPAERRHRALTLLAERWEANPPREMIVAAGSTGSIPATARLLKVIAGLPNGHVVLPGLDRDLDEDGWKSIEATHPQFGLAQLLKFLEVDRADVTDWPSKPSETAERVKLIGAALGPALSTAAWSDKLTLSADSLKGLTRVDAAHPQQEAQIIALLLREALETERRTAALVTPDRDLARRVSAELGRFGIGIDDSAGRPLATTPQATFLLLLAEAIVEGAAPAKLLAVLKHPLASGGIDTPQFRANARAVEMAVLRGPRPQPGLDALVALLRAEAAAEEKKTRDPAELLRLAAWLEGLATSARDFARLVAGDATPVDLLHAHIALAEAWAASPEQSGAARLWVGEAGEALAEFAADLSDAARDFAPIPGTAYPAFFNQCLAGRVIRPVWGGHARLHILGPLEARMLSFDLTILGGLNEGTWPPEAGADPWMSRPMRSAFGLPAPERRIGLAAHDFAQACASPAVVLTRAARVGGTPTVPSRWLQRLDAVLEAAKLQDHSLRRPELTLWQDELDAVKPLPAATSPAPRPPVAARPRRLSVTEIETWRRDPYALYAKRILNLKALDPLDADPGAAERGMIVHAALDEFVRRYPDALPADAEQRLLEIGRAAFGPALDRPGVWAFWWPRFEAIAQWFIAHEVEWRREAKPLVAEAKGRFVILARGGDFTLTGRADRIDRVTDGTLAIIDYKTGGAPDLKELAEGYLPQLPLEAAMARAGGFSGVPAASVSRLRYWHVPGGDPAGTEIAVDGATYGKTRTPLPDPMALADQALAGVTSLIDRFDDPATSYPARPRSDRALRYNDYAHLARVKEWSAEDDG
jgi:ATP-dependent helicase/nuclease subunit B